MQYSKVSKDFMSDTAEIYLDNSATTKVCPAAVKAVVEAMTQNYGNAASLHRKGYEAEQILIQAKKIISSILRCEQQELYFTSGATESNNLSLFGIAQAYRKKGNRIVISAIEHPSIMEAAKVLEQQGWEIVRVFPRQDRNFYVEDFVDVVNEKTILVSAMMVNNETGLILPILEIAKAVKQKYPTVLFHTDAVQGFLKLPIKLKNSGIDLLSASAHKIYGPKGIGLLYLKKGVRLTPLFYGGGQQNHLRVGTDSTALIAGFAAAVKEYHDKAQMYIKHYQQLNEYLNGLIEPISEITVHTSKQHVPYIVNLSIDRIRSEIMLHYLEQFGIFVSSGSACSKGAHSYVLGALGLSDAQIDTALRISFGTQTTYQDLEQLVKHLKGGISSLAKMK